MSRREKTVDELKEEVSKLEEALARAYTTFASPVPDYRGISLTGSEKRILDVLVQRRRVSYEQIYVYLYGLRDEGPDEAVVKVLISKLRKKLRPVNVNIATMWGQGYRIDNDSADRLLSLAGNDPQATNLQQSLETA
jgi:DNA-binding response OmpR family regulator